MAILIFALLPGIVMAQARDLNQCLCDCSCRAVGWDCYTSNEICKYDAQRDATLQIDCSKEDNGACLCRSGYGCTHVPIVSSGECYQGCVDWVNQGNTPAETSVCGDGVCNGTETQSTCAEDCAPKKPDAKPEICGNGIDDNANGLIDCFDTADCKCSSTPWITVTYKGEDGKAAPLVGATVTFFWSGTDGVVRNASAISGEDGKANTKLDGLWGGDGTVSYEISMVDKKFSVMNGNAPYTAIGEFTVKNEDDLQQRHDMAGDDRTVARIWVRSHEAYDFYGKLGANADNQMPEELYIKTGENGGAFHSMGSAGGAFPMTIDMGTTFRSKVFTKGFASKDSPQNSEWHEFNHHAMNAIYGGMWDSKRIKNHLGWGNPQSDDSYIEGFAEFMSLLETHAYADKYPRLAKQPSVYYWDGTASNLEKNFQVKDDEEFAVASILWDLYDPQSSSQIDKDHIELSRDTIWKVLSSKHTFSDGQTRFIHSTRDLYEAFKKLNDSQFDKKYTDAYAPHDDAWMDQAGALEKIFIAHGAYFDKNANGKWDPDEEVGYTQMKNSPAAMRTDKELPAGSYILANINKGEVQNGVANVKVKHDGAYSYLDFEYEADFENGLIGIEPPYDVPATYGISIQGDGGSLSNAMEMTSEDYIKNYDPTSDYLGTADFTLKTPAKGTGTGSGTPPKSPGTGGSGNYSDNGYGTGYGTGNGYDSGTGAGNASSKGTGSAGGCPLAIILMAACGIGILTANGQK